MIPWLRALCLITAFSLLLVFFKMTAAFSSAGTDIVTEHEASRYESLINAMR